MISVKDMIDVVYTYYPRKIARSDDEYARSPEYQRLIQARRKAGAENGTWRELLRRLGELFPANSVMNDSLHLPTGNLDGGYSGMVTLSADTTIGFLVSFLVPHYVVYCTRSVDVSNPPTASSPGPSIIFVGDTCHILPAWAAKLGALLPGRAELDSITNSPFDSTRVDFDFGNEERLHATKIIKEIETIWGYENMPPEIGTVIVPDVATDNRELGRATLYDCLFSDDRLDPG
ncbi:MAG: hypothetical protein IPK82_43520 [Polyangiaceae bacterium]|nr:hypothetical protein [Polyangiaceae bacterium]